MAKNEKPMTHSKRWQVTNQIEELGSFLDRSRLVTNLGIKSIQLEINNGPRDYLGQVGKNAEIESWLTATLRGLPDREGKARDHKKVSVRLQKTQVPEALCS